MPCGCEDETPDQENMSAETTDYGDADRETPPLTSSRENMEACSDPNKLSPAFCPTCNETVFTDDLAGNCPGCHGTKSLRPKTLIHWFRECREGEMPRNDYPKLKGKPGRRIACHPEENLERPPYFSCTIDGVTCPKCLADSGVIFADGYVLATV